MGETGAGSTSGAIKPRAMRVIYEAELHKERSDAEASRVDRPALGRHSPRIEAVTVADWSGRKNAWRHQDNAPDPDQ